MKTVPHIVEEKHLKLFYPEGIARNPTKVARKPRKPKQIKQKKQKSSQKQKAKKRKQKAIKGLVLKKLPQSAFRRQRDNIISS